MTDADQMNVTELRDYVFQLEHKVLQLRGLGTPGLVVQALEEIRATAANGLAVAEQQVLFWTTVRQWADTLATEEREDLL